MADTLNGNLQAFLWVIRHCEGTSGPDGYRTLFGGSLFDSFGDHPRTVKTFKLRKGGTLSSSAAGAYQILTKTWEGLVKNHKFTDFTPETQDKAAIALIKGRKAYQDILDGKFEQALTKCSWEWASLPPGRYGQPIKSVEECKKIYEQYGGTMVAPLVMAAGAALAKPFLSAAFEALAKELPTLGKLLGSGSEVSNRNLELAETVVEIVKNTVGAKNEQEAVEIVRADPELAKAADEAIKANAWDLFQIDLSGVGEARKADKETQSSPIPFWKNSPAFWVTLSILPLLYVTVYFIMTGSVEAGFSGEFKAATGSAVVTGILGGVIGFWLGASFTTSRSRGLNATPTP